MRAIATNPPAPTGLRSSRLAETSRTATGTRPAEHLFVNNVRFLSMAAVVCLHTLSALLSRAGLSLDSGWGIAVVQAVKFGTIGFFLISGFLLSESLDRRSRSDYLRRRLRTVAVPWLAWFAIFSGILLFAKILRGAFWSHSIEGTVRLLGQDLYRNLFTTAYWFVPNLLVAMCILLLCRRFLYDLWLGSLFLAVSLLHGVNVYAHWIPIRSHTEALLGFVFYLWLGAWSAHHFAAVQAWIRRIPMVVVLAITIASLGAATSESMFLYAKGAADPMNTLRVANQIYSTAFVLLVFRLRGPVSPKALDVRATTFGIYLSHTVMLAFLLSCINRVGPIRALLQPWVGTLQAILAMPLFGFAFVYGSSLLITRWLVSHPRSSWMVGSATSMIAPPASPRGSAASTGGMPHLIAPK